MRILTYRNLRPGRFTKALERLRSAVSRGDFAAVSLKKLSPTNYWRAKLSDEARLLLTFLSHNGETVCLFLEVIADHAYERSRFLRGASVDRDKIEAGPDDATPVPDQDTRSGWQLKWLPPEAAQFELLDKPIVFDDAFVNSDPVRTRAIQEMLDLAAARGLQVIVLTCNHRDYETLGAHLVELTRGDLVAVPPVRTSTVAEQG
jgi:hypothetical protein